MIFPRKMLTMALSILFLSLGAFFFFDGFKEFGFSLELIKSVAIALAWIIGGLFIRRF